MSDDINAAPGAPAGVSPSYLPPDSVIGLVDGAVPASTRRFTVVLAENAVVQLDDLVACRQELPDGRSVSHYGIVVEAVRQIEGASYASDTDRIARAKTMPGETSRRVEIQILRTVPELWLAPEPGSVVVRATGDVRREALFLDQMEQPLPAGFDQAGDPIYVDFSFLNGKKGGHVNISGISGVATKTSYALFLLYMLLETTEGRRMLGTAAPSTRALVFCVKGEDLLQLDRLNARFSDHPEAARGWATLGVPEPGPFGSVGLYVPRAAGIEGSLTPDVTSRSVDEVHVYGWSPMDFIRHGLLTFCFADADDARNQLSFIEQRARLQLARHAYPLDGEPGAVLLADPEPHTPNDFARLAPHRRTPKGAGEGEPVRSFGDLVEFLAVRLIDAADPAWTGNVQPNTAMAFIRRLYALVPRVGHLIVPGVTPVDLEGDAAVTVVDIHTLHDSAQRFVVGALLSQVFEAKMGRGREPLRFVLLDELNKYAPREGQSPLKDLLVDIAERGRALGVLLIGAQQAASAVAPAIIRNAAVKVVGRLDAGESAEYRFLSAELRERATRFLPGTMVIDQPLIPAPIPMRFPFPAFATSVEEGRRTDEARAADQAAVFSKL